MLQVAWWRMHKRLYTRPCILRGLVNVKVMGRTEAFRSVTKPSAPGEGLSSTFLLFPFTSAGIREGDGPTNHSTNTNDFFFPPHGSADRNGPYSDTPHWVVLLWMNDQPDAETSIWQYTTHNRHPCPRQDSNPQSQQASGRRPTH